MQTNAGTFRPAGDRGVGLVATGVSLPMEGGKARVGRVGRGFPCSGSLGVLGQRRDRVEHARRGERTRSKDALCPHWAGAPDIGVLVEQVQRPPVVGDLLAAVGPHDDPDGTLVNPWPGFGPPRREHRVARKRRRSPDRRSPPVAPIPASPRSNPSRVEICTTTGTPGGADVREVVCRIAEAAAGASAASDRPAARPALIAQSMRLTGAAPRRWSVHDG